MRTHDVGTERRVRSADHDRLAAPPEFVGDAFHLAPLADLAGDADKIGRAIVIDRMRCLVTELEAEILRGQPRNGRNGQIAIEIARRQATRREQPPR